MQPASASSASYQPSNLLVIVKDNQTSELLQAMCSHDKAVFTPYAAQHNISTHCHIAGLCRHTYQSPHLHGLAGSFTQGQLMRLQECLPEGCIDYVEEDVKSPSNQDSVQAADGPTPTSQSSSDQTLFMADGLKLQQLHTAQWGLDRIDQQYRPLNQTFMFGNSTTVGSGQGVTIYTMDSGIRQTHQEFQPWQGNAQRVSLGPSFASDSPNATDCDGHGTHIGSTAVGRTVGVAKEASMVAVRVLDCTGAGQVSDVVKGLEWVGLNHKLPAVVTMSLGVQAGQWSQTLQSAVTNLIDKHGITVVVATGNDQIDACQITPANVNGTIAAAGSDMSNKFNPPQSSDYELIYEYDNTGACVDVFAPGVDILAACGGAGRCTPLNDSNYAWASGTSMAVPHVAGAAAIYLAQNPNATPAQVSQAIIGASTPGLLDTDGMLPDTPNRLLYVGPNVI
ncbi:hypothetical protein WJX82_007705 [Trebouxia sp. C0006]